MGNQLTQEQRVIARLKEVGYVDNFWAFHDYILRLGAIMCQLKKLGFEFDTFYGTGAQKKNYIYKLKSMPLSIEEEFEKLKAIRRGVAKLNEK